MKRIGYIYKYSFPNGKVYIGQTRTSVQQRHYVHMSDARKKGRGTLCDVALAKYGEIQPETIETIEVDETESTQLQELLNEAEIKWIKFYDSTNKQKGYNIQQGGEIVTPDIMILEEKWHEIFEKEKWGEALGYLHSNLESIGNKLYVTKEKLDKDERYVWYGYRFDLDNEKNMSFSKFYNRYKGFEIEENIYSYKKLVLQWAWDEYIKDVQRTIWQKVNKHKDKYIKEYRANAKIKRS